MIMRPATHLSFGIPPALVALAIGVLTAGSAGAQEWGPGQWQILEESNHATARHESGYVKVGERFYLVGGRGVKPVEIFDPITRTWSAGAPPPIEMHHFQAVEHDGKLYVVGAMTGAYPTEPPIPVVYVYDPGIDQWSTGPEIPADRRRGGAGAVAHEGRIYIVAGIQNGHTDGHVAWMDAFDPRTGEWHRLPDAPRPRDHFQLGVIDGRMYAAGGRRSSGATGEVFQLTVPEVDVYDFATGRWTTLPESANLPTPRAGTATAVLDGRLLVIGGESGSQETAHSEVEAYDPATSRWTSLAPLRQGRHATQAILHDGRLYLVAGSSMRGALEIDSQEVFTP